MAKRKLASDNDVTRVIEVSELDPKIYNGIAKCATLLGIQLITSDFNITPEFFKNKDDGKLSVDFSVNHGSFDEQNRVVTCIFDFESSKKINRRKAFCLRSSFIVFYGIPIDCDELHAITFAKKTGLMAAYPFFRSHASHTASLANAEMPVLPMIASMPLKEKRVQEIEQ